MEKERETMVIDGRLHMQGDDGLFRRIPLGMDDAQLKEGCPAYRLEDGKPVKAGPRSRTDDFTAAVESIPTDGLSMGQ